MHINDAVDICQGQAKLGWPVDPEPVRILLAEVARLQVVNEGLLKAPRLHAFLMQDERVVEVGITLSDGRKIDALAQLSADLDRAAADENANARDLVAAQGRADAANARIIGLRRHVRKRAKHWEGVAQINRRAGAEQATGTAQARAEVCFELLRTIEKGLDAAALLAHDAIEQAKGAEAERAVLRNLIVGPDDARWQSVFGLDITFKGKVREYAEGVRDAAKAIFNARELSAPPDEVTG